MKKVFYPDYVTSVMATCTTLGLFAGIMFHFILVGLGLGVLIGCIIVVSTRGIQTPYECVEDHNQTESY